MNTYFTILCGGSGTRLWPLSRKNRPKQFVPFLGNKTLLEQTIERIEPLAKNKNHIGVVTTQEQIQLIKQTAGNKIGFIVEEPCARNTGPALLYACFEIQKKDPYSIITFMHSDAFIPDAKNFREHLSVAIKYAKKIISLQHLELYQQLLQQVTDIFKQTQKTLLPKHAIH